MGGSSDFSGGFLWIQGAAAVAFAKAEAVVGRDVEGHRGRQLLELLLHPFHRQVDHIGIGSAELPIRKLAIRVGRFFQDLGHLPATADSIH